jgi:Tfp pilus assembly protein PilZ
MRRRRNADSLQRECRAVRMSFDTLEDLRAEYRENLQRGGLFVPHAGPFEMREEVQVEFDLCFAGTSFELRAEVVGVLPEGLPHSDGRAGVALQLGASAADLARAFEPILGRVPAPDPGQQVGERRVAARYPARLMGRMSSDDGDVAVRTRNLSRSGVLVSIEGLPPVPIGGRVDLLLAHPTSGEELAVDGVVVRHLESEGHVPALAVAFTEEMAAQPEVERLIDELQAMAHARDLASITGPLSEMGLASLLQSFAVGTPRGTITVTRGHEEGRVLFENGQLLAVQAGAATGPKGLARLLAWDDGRFEFHSHLDDVEREDSPLRIEVALLDAARQVDERRRLDPLPFAGADVHECAEGADATTSCKTEAAVLDLVQAGFTVRAILDVVPEEDHAVLHAIVALIDRGVIRAA